MKQPEIYFHVGMGKTGTTFLQYQVFPKIRGLRYLHGSQKRRTRRIIAKGKSDKYLVSGEQDNRFIERSLKNFSDPFNFARPILVIRRHDEWITSQYRRYLKNGNHWRFADFFDLEKDEGYWKQESLYYYPIVLLLEKYFLHKPLVLLYDDLKKDPRTFILNLVEYMGAGIRMDRINLSPRHTSYNKKQLMAIYHATERINLKKRRPFQQKWKNFVINLFTNALRYAILYGALILPGKISEKERIFPTEDQLRAIREHYNEDWEKCLAYAKLSKTPR